MSGRLPTPEQAAAIAAGGRDVLVEAGAGTGKTGVMVERYCRLVCEDGVSPEAVLAFTFTEKAAAELRGRIRAELEARAERGSERAAALLPQLGGAPIATIHGFCNRLLAAHPVAVGIDPRFRVLDDSEAERAAREAFDEALAEFLRNGDAARERTVAAYEVEGLRAMVRSVHAELRSRGIAEPRLPDPPAADVAAALKAAAEAAAATLEELGATGSGRERLERALATLCAEPAPDLDAVAELRTGSRARSMALYREAIEAAVARVAEAGEGGTAYGHVAELLELFSARFGRSKERRAGLDFEDLQLLAVRLLERTETGAAYRSRFSHLLVDEFQDTNRLQLRLIEALRGPGSRLMAVGDELQSIYGFRHADLDVFRERRRAIEADPEAEALSLSGNFRAQPELIGAVNAIGERLLGDGFRPLRVGSAPEPGAAPGEGPVELLLTARDGWDEEAIDLQPATDARTPASQLAEARFLAARLRELVDAGVGRGQIVVLLRAFTHLDAFEDSLERAGLRPYVVGGRGYWSQQQVADLGALLATIANPLDDRALLGALASPACGVAPDTLWLLRAAAGARRPLWPTLEAAVAGGSWEPAEPERLERIPAGERELLGAFAETLAGLRRDAGRLSLPELVDAAATRTGYDLAVLTRDSGEARFANVRKLMRLAAEFEAAEGRDLRGLLDFLASRAAADADAGAATALEGHDGVRLMTVHSAKGLEFDVVAVPGLSRGLLAAKGAPLLALGHEPESPRVGMQLRRLGAAAVNLYANRELREEAQGREAEEELRLFHVAATRARRRLLLSGVIRPEPPRETKPSTPVVERIVEAFGVDRTADSSASIPPPLPRAGLEVSFAPSELAVRVNLASPEGAAALTETRREEGLAAADGEGPAPLLELRPRAPKRPLSYTAISERGELSGQSAATTEEGVRTSSRYATRTAKAPAGADRDEAAGRGIAAHTLLEWMAVNDWGRPEAEAIRRHARAAGLDPDGDAVEGIGALLDAWTGSAFFEREVRPAPDCRPEVPLLIRVAGTILRGSIDLLVERDGEPPLIVDYKTDRLGSSAPAERVGRYAVQRDIYALGASEALGTPGAKVAYVFLERPEEPAIEELGPVEIGAARERIEAAIESVDEAA